MLTDPLTLAMNELKKAWYEENDRDTTNLSPRDIGLHVGMKSGLNKAINILSKHVVDPNMTEFEKDCIHHHGRILTGKYKHYCAEWDMLPLDETCHEYKHCICFPKEGDNNE